jgi:hypothetical protein
MDKRMNSSNEWSGSGLESIPLAVPGTRRNPCPDGLKKPVMIGITLVITVIKPGAVGNGIPSPGEKLSQEVSYDRSEESEQP